MSEIIVRDASLPSWYLETFQVIQRVEGRLRNAELELREAIEMTSLDERVRFELEGALDALQGIKGNLAVADMTARDVLDQMLSEIA